MQDAAARVGIRIGVTDPYRSHAAQVKVAEEKGLYSEGGLGAQPGTSDHGWGLALDLDLDAAALAWMPAMAPVRIHRGHTPRTVALGPPAKVITADQGRAARFLATASVEVSGYADHDDVVDSPASRRLE